MDEQALTRQGGEKIPEGDNSMGRGLVGGWCKLERLRSGRVMLCRP